MQLYLTDVFQLHYPVHVSNKPVHHQEVISVHAAQTISHTSMGYLPANTVQVPPDDGCNRVEDKRREENQLDATECFIALINLLNMFRALICPSSRARYYTCVIAAYGV